MKSEQQLNTQIDAAAAVYHNNPRRLRRLTRQLRQRETKSSCLRSAKLLLKYEPESVEAIASLIFSYSNNRSENNLRTALDLAHQRAANDPKALKIILRKYVAASTIAVSADSTTS